MNMLFRRAARLIAVGAFVVVVPALASASNPKQTASFKLAMGPTSAAQKTQGPAMTEQSGSVEVKPRHRVKPHDHRIKHHRRHY